MEAGIDREQIKALKASLRKACQNPGKLKLIVSAVIVVFGFFLYCSPAAGRLAEGRKKLEKIQGRARLAKESRHFVEQSHIFLDRCPKTEDVGDWQDYIMQQVKAAGVKLRTLEPRKGLMKGKYRIILLELEVVGMFGHVVDLIDRLERGERIIRLDRVALEKRTAYTSLRCVVMGLVKLRG